MNQPSISVIIPVFNGEKFVADAIQSIRDQNYESLEIIVIDDGSTDNTSGVVKKLGNDLILFSRPNQGVAAARNAGLQRATGDLITFLDADDVWTKNKLSLQTNILKENPEVDVVFGMLLQVPFMNFDDLQSINLTHEKGFLATQLGSMLIKRHVFGKTGLFDPEMKLGEDLDWFNRMRESGAKVMVHSEIVQFYRKHNQSLTHDNKLKIAYQIKTYKKALERRKLKGIDQEIEIPEMINFEEVKKRWVR